MPDDYEGPPPAVVADDLEAFAACAEGILDPSNVELLYHAVELIRSAEQ